VLALPSAASDLENALQTADRLDLAAHPTWRGLLHFESGRAFSSVKTDSFFLDPQGRADPAAELQATLEAYFRPDEARLTDPLCRFPARYYWLSGRVELPGYDPRNPACERLESWALFDRTHSLSLLYVSGYLGNPASTFGHSLLKLNSGLAAESTNYFDITLNFGALVPEFENAMVYIIRGLFGGYVAGFSDKHFYTQDLVYSRSEYRDMWEYELNLTEEQRTLLILHLWEIIGKKYRYFFLSRNCGFRIGEVLDLVVEDDLLGSPGPWYIPEDLFHTIARVDGERRARGARPLIKETRFIPSYRRKVNNRLAALEPGELDLFNRIVADGFDHGRDDLDRLEMGRRAEILDDLLAYYSYKISGTAGLDSTAVIYQEKNKAVRARMALPLISGEPPPPDSLPAPTTGFRPMGYGFGFGSVGRGHQFASVVWSPFTKRPTDWNSLGDNEIILLDMSIGTADTQPLFLDRLDFMRILSLNTQQPGIHGEARRSWKLRCGLDRKLVEGDNRYDGMLGFGVGRAWAVQRRGKLFALVSAEAHTRGHALRLYPEIGAILGGSRLKLRAGVGAVSTDYEGNFRERWQAILSVRIGRQQSVHLEHRRDAQDVTRLVLTRFY